MSRSGSEHRRLRAAVASASLALVAVSLTGSRELVYDERYYVRETVDLFHRLGPTVAFLDAYPYPAGLPNAVLLAPLDPLGGLRPPAVRVYNLLLLAGVCAGVGRLTRPAGGPGWAGLALANPVIWALAGLALTEMLAVACCTLAAAALVARRVPLAAAGGAAFGLAVLTRPQLLVLAPGLAVVGSAGGRPAGRLTAFAAAAAALCLPVFGHWGGLVSPAVDRGNYSNQSVSPLNAVLASGYAGGMFLLVAPRWFRLTPAAAQFAVAAAVVAAVVAAAGGLEFKPFATLAGRLLPAAAADSYPRLMGGLLAAVAAVFWVATVARLGELRHTSALGLGAGLAVAAVVLSCAKIAHQFSSRYVAVAFPFVLMAATPYRSGGWGEVARLAVGAVLGAAMLRTYFG